MKTRVEITLEKRRRGYNCAQAVACTYCDLLGIDEDQAFRMLEGFGAGMGNMEHTCGAVSGAIALAGLKNSEGKNHPVSKAKTYQLSKQILNAFQERNQSTFCKELKGIGSGHQLRDCPGCITDAAKIVEQLLFNEKEEL